MEKLQNVNYCVHELQNNEKVHVTVEMSRHPKADFIIKNTSNETNLLYIDGCLTFPPKKRKCDFATWNVMNFYFVEIKQLTKIKNRKNNKKHAIEQLFDTISLFHDKQIDYQGREVSAIISWGYKFPGEVVTTTMQSKEIEFKQKFNVNLFEGNQLTL